MTPPTAINLSNLTLPHPTESLKGRKRSSSLLKVEEVGGRVEQFLDRSAYVNINANWVNAKGLHICVVSVLRTHCVSQEHG
jgi:hypothetical protein